MTQFGNTIPPDFEKTFDVAVSQSLAPVDDLYVLEWDHGTKTTRLLSNRKLGIGIQLLENNQ
jgi:hypothetical protein